MQSKKARILYVDEDAENSFILETVFRRAGYDPLTVNFAGHALQFAHNESFDLFVLAKRFPIGSGVYLCNKLHEIAPNTPIVFLSNQADGFKWPAGIHTHAQEYIISSGDANELMAVAHQLLSEQTELATATM